MESRYIGRRCRQPQTEEGAEILFCVTSIFAYVLELLGLWGRFSTDEQ